MHLSSLSAAFSSHISGDSNNLSLDASLLKRLDDLENQLTPHSQKLRDYSTIATGNPDALMNRLASNAQYSVDLQLLAATVRKLISVPEILMKG